MPLRRPMAAAAARHPSRRRRRTRRAGKPSAPPKAHDWAGGTPAMGLLTLAVFDQKRASRRNARFASAFGGDPRSRGGRIAAPRRRLPTGSAISVTRSSTVTPHARTDATWRALLEPTRFSPPLWATRPLPHAILDAPRSSRRAHRAVAATASPRPLRRRDGGGRRHRAPHRQEAAARRDPLPSLLAMDAQSPVEAQIEAQKSAGAGHLGESTRRRSTPRRPSSRTSSARRRRGPPAKKKRIRRRRRRRRRSPPNVAAPPAGLPAAVISA